MWQAGKGALVMALGLGGAAPAPRGVLVALLALSVGVTFHARAGVVPATPATDTAAATPNETVNPEDAPEAMRDEFMAAMQRIRLRVPEPPDSPALQHYVIHDYLVAARLRRDLLLTPGADLDALIDAFLQSHAQQPVTRALRHDWLVNLAERRRWDWFLPRAADLNDPILICDRLEGRLETGNTPGLAVDALARWNVPQRAPSECDGVFAWLRQQGLLSAGLAEVRTRAALADGNAQLAREFAADVPTASAAPLLQWVQLLASPKPALETLAHNVAFPVEADALEAGFNRLARQDAATALTLLPQLLARPDMSPALRGRLQRDVALGAAYERDPAALARLRDVPAEAVDDEVREWRVRAALWSGDYPAALGWIEQMPAALATLPRWRYWRARAVEATRGAAAAAPLYADVAALRDYYGYLAADRLHRPYALNAQPSLDDETAQSTLAARPGLERAHALLDCDMTDEAGVEWAVELSDVDPKVKIQAAHIAARWGWYAQSIATLAQAGDWDDVRLRYPRPYPTAITRASDLTHVPGDLILAVIRQESLFRKDAVSRADARGLMQMRPATAAALARRWHLPPPGPDTLFDPVAAVTLGAAYLREMLDRYAGQLAPGLAAYNAGPVPVARWLPSRPMDADVWIENIAFGETRDYLERIFEHIVAYAWVRDAEPPRLAALLPAVEPPASAAGAAQAPGAQAAMVRGMPSPFSHADSLQN
ncbi:MAG TPA: transglycosylase SLT domain-containing protein [Steroidobacteraceae bacterium]